MTREEYTELLHCDFIEEAQVYVASLEQRIAELESPRTCEGCFEFRKFTDDEQDMYHEDGICTSGESCAYRVFNNFGCNCYEPKKDTE